MSPYILREVEDDWSGSYYHQLLRAEDDEVICVDGFADCPEDATFDRSLRPVFDELNRVGLRAERLEHAIERALDKFDSGKQYDAEAILSEAVRR